MTRKIVIALSYRDATKNFLEEKTNVLKDNPKIKDIMGENFPEVKDLNLQIPPRYQITDDRRPKSRFIPRKS